MTDKVIKQIANNLRQLRKARGLTQIELAEKAKINSNYYSKVERGELKPSADIYAKIAKGLGVKLDQLFKI